MTAGRHLAPAAPGALVRCDPAELATRAAEWDELALRAGSPFLTQAWLQAWWAALGDGEPLCGVVRGPEGELRAAAWCRLAPGGELTAPTDSAYGYDWDVAAVDADARRQAWEGIARFGARRLRLAPIEDRPEAAGAAVEALERCGYRVLRRRVETSPFVSLPESWDALLAAASRKLRHQWRHNRRALDQAGGLALRTARTVEEVARDLDVFLAVEASGWKRRAGTAILCDPRAERLFRSFALAAARQGWLRLSVLETGGTPVAASLGCSFAGRAFRLKSGFDERFARHSPGLVLLGEDLRRSIEEGLREYHFMGAAQEHKMRWGSETRDRVSLHGYRGLSTLPAYGYRAHLRPVLGRLRRAVTPAAPRARAHRS